MEISDFQSVPSHLWDSEKAAIKSALNTLFVKDHEKVAFETL